MGYLISVSDNKWNFGSLKFYTADEQPSHFHKINNNKTVDEETLTPMSLSENELYISFYDNAKELYNSNEYVKIYTVYQYELLETTACKNDINLMTEDFALNIKSQTEFTEENTKNISNAFTEINTELKKDDDLIAKDLFDVDKKIEELKKSRKKWASGKVAPIFVKERIYPFIVIKPNVDFKIKNIIITIKSTIYSVRDYQTYTVIPYSLNCSTFSCLYIGNENTAGRYDVENISKNGLTFIHYSNKSAGDYTDTILKIQSELPENQFIIANGSENEINMAISRGEIDISFFATE